MVDEPPTLETTPVDLPPEIIALLAAFVPLFSDRAWAKAQVLAVGAILAAGNRTVCSALRIMGLSRERHFTNPCLGWRRPGRRPQRAKTPCFPGYSRGWPRTNPKSVVTILAGFSR